MNVARSLKNKCSNGVIRESDALAIGRDADQALAETIDMLRRCKKQVGMFIGGEISELLGRLEGVRFNEKEYYHEKTVEGQDT